MKYREFREKNKNLILKATTGGAEQKHWQIDANQVLRDIVGNGGNTLDVQQDSQDEIMKFCEHQARILDGERKSLISDSAIEKPFTEFDKKQKRQMGYTIMLNFDGRRYKSDMLPSGIKNPIELRTKSLLSRIKLLEMLKNRKFAKNGDLSKWNDEISEYNRRSDELVVIKGDVGDINDKVLGEQLKFYTLDYNKRYGTEGEKRTVVGWEMMKNGAYYGFKENTGKIDWNNTEAVQKTINYTMGQITQEKQIERDFGGVYGEKEIFIGENGESKMSSDVNEMSNKDILITKPHFLEMCAIVHNVFCDTKMNFQENSYIVPKPIFEDFNEIMNSDEIKKYFLKNSR